MKTTFDKLADAVYIGLNEHKVHRTYSTKYAPVNLDFDENGELIGIEVLCASRVLPLVFLVRAKKIGPKKSC